MAASRLCRDSPERPNDRTKKTAINPIRRHSAIANAIWCFMPRARATPNVWRNGFRRHSTATCLKWSRRSLTITIITLCWNERRKSWRLSVRAISRLSKPRWKVSTITTSYSSVFRSGTVAWLRPCRRSCTNMPRNLPENESHCSPPAAAAAFPLRSARPATFAPMRRSSTEPCC